MSWSCRTNLVACFCNLSHRKCLKYRAWKLTPHGFLASSAICVVQKLNCCHLVLDALDCYCFSYHTLFNLRYNHRVGETAAAKKKKKKKKKNGAEKGISVQEAERRLNTKLFLEEIPKWEPGRLHHLFLFQKMFAHMKAIGLKEYHCGIHWGHWQPSLERDLWAKASAMEMLTLETTQDKVMALYQEVYQLKSNPREAPCSEDTTEEIHIKILEMLRECLQHRWGPTQPEELEQEPLGHLLQQNTTPKSRWDVIISVTSGDSQQESQVKALRVAREAHHWALAAAAMLEGYIVWLNHSISWGCHRSWEQSASHQCSGSRRWSRSRGCSRSRRHRSHRGKMALPAGHPDYPARRQTASCSLVRPKRRVTLEDPKDTKVKWNSPPTTHDRKNLEATGSWPQEPKNLGHPPQLKPCVQEFLSRTGSPGRDESDQSLEPKLPFDDPQEWVRWHAHRVETLAW